MNEPAPVPTHGCHADGCLTQIPVFAVMCEKHWAMVPLAMKQRLWSVLVDTLHHLTVFAIVEHVLRVDLVRDLVVLAVKHAEQPLPEPDAFHRASGEMPCEDCGFTYYQHPVSVHATFLNVLCDGRYVKL